jgi:hypothetical protein
MGIRCGSALSTTVTAVAALAFACPAGASQLVGFNASNVGLQVDPVGASVSFVSGGVSKRLYASGAVNARHPSTGPQVAFSVRPGGAVRGACGGYDGPPLPWLVAACKAPDGSYWALQSWQRRLPNYGLTPSGTLGAWELRLSHWRGQVARLEIELDWSYRRFVHVYGRLTYSGLGVYGFRATRWGEPLDDYGRNIYVDTFGSAYGAGWKRENSFLAHRPNGVFCYGFYPHAGRPAGNGSRYRATVIGPGVTPDVSWEGTDPGPFDLARDRAAAGEQRRLFAGDRLCRPR